MSRDPFYEEILAGLNSLSDSKRTLFQDCVTDLLRDTFRSLVPVRGGKDSGMDGAIADGKGEPYPLVVTTAKDVERNLKQSLDSWLKRKRPRRDVVLATSQALAPERQHKLKDLAQEKGCTLVGLIEQSGIADRLRENGYWRERLLGLTGEPSTLSVVPASRRPLLDVEPIGRDGDIEWLKPTSGDRVLSGAPGSGKTFLLYHLTRQGWGVFVVSPEGPVAKDLRNQKPEVVIFDDAHLQPEFLVKLRHLRQETKLSFSIVATTWEGEKDKVIDALGVSESQVRRLELLTRNEILEVYRRLGVEEDADTMRYLVDQAANKPGLAATIGTFWLRGEWQEVIEGKALSRGLLTFFEQHVGLESTDILAAFSLGGDRGVEVEAVREFLGLSRLQIRQLAAGLAVGGVLSEVDRDVWAVWPRPLRFALIRTVFFPASAPRHRYEDLIGKIPCLGRAVETLIAAKALGADIPSLELRDLVVRSGSPRAWKEFAQLAKEEAEWVLEHYSEVTPRPSLWGEAPADTITAELLRQIPRKVIPKIFERASELAKLGDARPQQPMRILSDWVQDYWAGPEEWIRRRRILALAAKKFLLEGGEREIGVQGICIALSPKLFGDSLDPGKGNTLTMLRGLLPSETLRQIEPIWEEAKDAIQVLDAASWHHLSSILWDWIYQKSAGSKEDAEAKRELMREFSARVLRDLVPLGQGSPGLQADFARFAKEVGISLELEQDATFLLLCPGHESNGEKAAQEERVKALATEWAQDDPEVVARKIADYQQESQKRSYGGSSNIWELCEVLANEVQEPESWLDAFLAQNLGGDLAGLFLWRIVRDRREDWESRLNRCLGIESLKSTAAKLVLMLQSPSISLLEKVLDESADIDTLVEGRCLNRKVPVSTLSLLLRRHQREIALAAAVGEWCANPQGTVREEIMSEWRSAILRSSSTERNASLQYWLGCILSGDASLALEWLRARLHDPDLPRYFMEESPFAQALRSLQKDQKLALLQELEPIPIVGYMIPLLIQEDVELYGRLLSLRRLVNYHLVPLRGIPQKGWRNLALVALQAGYEPDLIAKAAFGTSHVQVGSGIEYWEKWDLAFAELGREEIPELQEIFRKGREIAQMNIQEAQGWDLEIDRRGLPEFLDDLRAHRSSR